MFEYILPACARLSKALKEKFASFLPAVMAPLLAGASQEIKFSIEEAEEGD